MQLNIFYACKIFSPNIKYFCSGSERAGADAGAGGQEPEQHRGQPVAEAGERGLGLQPRQHCEYYRHSTVQYSTVQYSTVLKQYAMWCQMILFSLRRYR